MAEIRIQTKQDFIPIHLGDEEIRFYVNDDSLLRIQKGADRVKKEIDAIKPSDDEEEVIEQMKEALKKGFDFIFEEGSFEKAYSVTPSVFVVLEYFQQMVEAAFNELDKRKLTVQQKAQKYLQQKKK